MTLKMKINISTVLLLLSLLLATQAGAQMYKGRWAVGGEFSFLNSRNDQSSGSNNFSEELNTGFSFRLNGGQFVSQKLYTYGVAGITYSTLQRNYEMGTSGAKEIRKTLANATTIGIGGGTRWYIKGTERVGFFLQGQAVFSGTNVRREEFYSENDTVQSDAKVKYPFYSLDINIKPGVYLIVSKRWQLTFNLGNLYFTQTWQPEKTGVVGRSSNSTFGMDVNLFDFRVGALYLLGKNE